MAGITKFARFKHALLNLPPTAHAKAVYVGQCWAVAGLIVGTGFLVYNGFWYFSLFLTAMIFLQGLQLISARQKYKHLEMMMNDDTEGDNQMEDTKNEVIVKPRKKPNWIQRTSWACYQVSKGVQPLIIMGIAIYGLDAAGVKTMHWTFWPIWIVFAYASLGYFLRINEKLEG